MKRWLLRFNTWLFVLLVLLAIAALGWLSDRYRVNWVWSSFDSQELSEPTRKLLDAIEGEVVAVAFVPRGHVLDDHVDALLALYSAHKADFQYQKVNPDARPDLVRALGVERVGEIVLQYGERQERVAVPTEARISAALERLVRGQGAFVAYLAGHGERNLLGEANHDLGAFGKRLESKGYRLQPVYADTAAIPDNTALLVLSAPQTALAPGEQRRVLDYLARGGSLLLLADPEETAHLGFLSQTLSLRWQEGIVEDPLSAATLQVDDPHLVLVERYPSHPVVEPLQAPVLLVRAAAFEAEAAGWRTQPLLIKDSAVLGAAMTRRQGEREQRVVVLGDGDWLSNTYIGNGANLALGLNLVDWLTESELFLDAYARGTPDQRLAMSRGQLLTLGLGFLLGVPMLCLLFAAAHWWRRRSG